MSKKTTPITNFVLTFVIWDTSDNLAAKTFTKIINVYTPQRISKLITAINAIIDENSAGVMKCICITTNTGDENILDTFWQTNQGRMFKNEHI